MKRILQITALAFIIMLGGSWRNSASAQVSVDISYQTFYDELSPYGEWVDYPDYGWMWVPGYEWSPAWVAWRDGGDYYGWAPLRPGFNISIGFSNYNPPVDYWCFAPRQYISSPRIYDYCLDRGRNVTIINNTTIINNYGRRNNVFINGPRRMDAERYAGRINPVRMRDASGP